MNIELLEKCFDQIVFKPHTWKQSEWSAAVPIDRVPVTMQNKIEKGKDAQCGTTACLAGHAMVQSGEYKQIIVFVNEDQAGNIRGFDVDMVRADGVPIGLCFDDDDDIGIDEAYIQEGARLLDLDRDVAYDLFHATHFTDPHAFLQFVVDTLQANGDLPYDYVLPERFKVEEPV